MRTVLTHVLHVLSKGLRVAVQSGSIQWCTRTTYGVWVLANQSAGLRSRAQQGGRISYGNSHSVETGENHEKKMFWIFKKNWKKCGKLRGLCFIATQNFKLKHITRCELWKRQNQCWIVPNSNVTIQGWICLFYSSYLVMCFNLKFCVAIKHHPLNIPYFFFRFVWNFKIWFPRSFHWILVSVSYSPNTRENIIRNPTFGEIWWKPWKEDVLNFQKKSKQMEC